MSSKLAYLTPPQNNFEEAYLSTRRKEGRLYTDEIVRQLPNLPNGHPQEKEWGLRTRNVQYLIQHLQQTNPERILDLGCGNGWLTHQLVAGRKYSSVLGLDVNIFELEQAQRLFANSNCQFAYGDIFKAKLEIASFDTIILASCAQYFPDFTSLLDRLMALLKPQGEIHIFDTPFYTVEELKSARQRTMAYYQEQDDKGMQQYYHHRSWAELQSYWYEVKYQPKSITNRIKRKIGLPVSPFPWFIIRHTALPLE